MNAQDRKFLDLFLVVIGLLMIFAVGLFGLSRFTATGVQHGWIAGDERVRAQVQARIAPVGQVVTDPEAIQRARAAAAETEPTRTAMTGPQVYQQACTSCHGGGIGGAPVTGDIEAWAARIDQGMDTLYEHSIDGFMGDAGYMPPKGGRTDLSDEEVRAAVDFMVDESTG